MLRPTISALVAATASGCILPDIGIVVYATQGCGYQYVASTNGASGYTGSGVFTPILIDGQPIVRTWCLTPEEFDLMAYEDSWIYIQVREDIIDACYDRAIELELGQVNCEAMVSIAYSGECPGEHEWCEEGTGTDTETESADEVGAAT